MKTKRKLITAIVCTALIILVTVRLIANKHIFDEQLRMVSEFNTTIPVKTDTVRYIKTNTSLSVHGLFEPFHEITMASEVQGKITGMSVQTGDQVKAGQLLAMVDNQLSGSQLELAGFNLEKAEKDVHRFEELSRSDAATEQQLESARQTYVNAKSAYTSAKVQFDHSYIRAPFDGFITKRSVEKGSFIQPGMPIFEMIGIRTIKFSAHLTEEEIRNIRKDQNVTISADAYPGITFNGKVSSISVKADESKKYEVQAEVVNHPDHLLRPGMFGYGAFDDPNEKEVLAINRKVISGSLKDPEVFVVRGDSVVLQKIKATPVNEIYIAINAGLNAGDVVVTSGQINLINGSKITFDK